MSFADDLKYARAGDTEAMARLFEPRRNSLRSLAKNLLPAKLQPKLDQSDLIQETFFKVMKGVAGFAGDSEESFNLWLTTAARQACLDAITHHLGAQKRNPDHPARLNDETAPRPDPTFIREATFSTPSLQAVRNEQALRIQAAQRRLTDVQQQVLKLRYEEKFTLREIAQCLNLTEGQITGIWRRSLDQLEKLLKTDGDSGLMV